MVVLQRAWCSLHVTFRFVVRANLVYRTPPLLGCIPGSCLDLGRLFVLLLGVGSSRLSVADASGLPPVADEMALLPAVTTQANVSAAITTSRPALLPLAPPPC